MKNKLSLKVLKQEIERLKASKDSTIKKDIGHDIKNSYINKLYTKSSALWLYILTGVLGYAHRIPYIGRIVSLLSLWYGRTTIWKILVKIRKVFIVFNAIIGVYIVFKSVGFSTDNLMGGFYGVGHTYIETFYKMTKRLFYWFVELFDHKVIPNIPGGDIPDYPKNLPLPINSYKYPEPRLYDFSSSATKARDIFGFFDTTELVHRPWYKDSSTWFWIIGVTLTIGLGVLGYKLINDPTILEDLITKKSGGPGSSGGANIAPIVNIENASPTNETVPERVLGKAVDIAIGLFKLPGRVGGAIVETINPLNYITSAAVTNQQWKDFLELQSYPETADLRYYPFTVKSPYDSWLAQLKKHYISESAQQMFQRNLDRDLFYQRSGLEGSRRLNVGTDTLFSLPTTVANSRLNSPLLGTVGLKSFGATGIGETFSSINADIVERKLASIPGTPKTLTGGWGDHTKATDPESMSWLDDLQARRMKPGESSDRFSHRLWLITYVKEVRLV